MPEDSKSGAQGSDSTPWRVVNPPSLADPIGYAHAIASRGGTRIALAGQTAMNKAGAIQHRGDLPAQCGLCFDHLLAVLHEAGGHPHHLVRMRMFVLDADDYASNAKVIGAAYRKRFGKWFPAMTLVQVARLYDPHALIEIEAEAVIPDQ